MSFVTKKLFDPWSNVVTKTLPENCLKVMDYISTYVAECQPVNLQVLLVDLFMQLLFNNQLLSSLPQHITYIVENIKHTALVAIIIVSWTKTATV